MLMSPIRKSIAIATNDTGSVMVIVAAFVPLAILFVVFVVDIGKAFEHNQHLQLQADAGVLAAAQEFQPCNNEKIRAALREYSGKSGAAHLYNKQIGETADKDIHEELNKLKYFEQPATKDGTVEAEPCEANMVDLKITETHTPLLFKALKAPYVNAHARVEIRQETETSGFLPVSLVDSTPRSAAACFVNEATGEILKSTPLEKGTSSAGGSGLVTWTNEGAPVAVPISNSAIAVHVALSAKATTSCTDTGAKVYDLGSSGRKGPSLLHIQGWSLNAKAGDGGTGHPKPVVREVRLTPEAPPSGCSDPYFSNPATGTTCTIGVSAVVDYGSPTPPTGAAVTAEVSGKTYNLTEAAGKWTAGGISVKAGQGSVAVTLKVTDTAMGGAGKALAFPEVQRTYTAIASKSGPIQSARVSEGGAGDANSFRICEPAHEGAECEPKLVVTIGTLGLKNAESVSEPFLKLPVSKGINNCPTGSNFKQRLAQGCQGDYAILPSGGTCATSGAKITCITLENGVKANDFAAGLNQRILGSEKPSLCTSPNNWSTFPNLPKNDPRIVTIVLTPFGFETEPLPIEEFGTFYITGWEGSGSGFTNPCEGHGDDPAGSSEMVGHFIKYINTTDSTGGGPTRCERDAFGQCVAVLTQ
jgi:hypothetical protein